MQVAFMASVNALATSNFPRKKLPAAMRMLLTAPNGPVLNVVSFTP